MRVLASVLVRHHLGHSAPEIAARLAELGGRLTSWRPEVNRVPALASFWFDSEGERDRFLAGALQVPGVSLASPIDADHPQQDGARSAAA